MKLNHLPKILTCLLVGLLFLPAAPLPVLAQDKSETEQEDGQADLEKAMEKSGNASSTRDLDQVVRLLDSALGKDLDDESRQVALNLMRSTLLNHADELGKKIFSQPRDVRWQFYRRQALQKLARLTEMENPPYDAFVMVAKLQTLPNGDLNEGREAIEKAKEIAAAEGNEDLTELELLGAMLAEDATTRLEEISKILEKDPENVRALEIRAQLYAEDGELLKAAEDLKVIMRVQPENIPVQRTLLQIYLREEDRESAAEVLELMAENNPDDTQALMALAQLRIEMEQMAKALDPLNKALELDSSLLGAINMRATVLLTTEKYEDALVDIEALLEADPDDIRARLFRGLALAGLKKYDEALEDFDVLIDAVPQEPTFKLQKARILMDSGKVEEGLKIYDKMLERRQRDTSVLRSRGDAFLGIGNHARAIADYDQGLEIDEEDSGILNNLAWLLSTTPYAELRDGKRAIELATKACELTEYKEAHILSTLASSYAEADDWENALKWAEKAVVRGEETDSSQMDSLRAELEAYKLNKKWREYLEESGAEGEIEFELPPIEKGDDGQDASEENDKGDDGNDDGGSEEESADDDGASLAATLRP